MVQKYGRLGGLQSGRIHDRPGLTVGAEIADTFDRKNLGKLSSCAIHPALDGTDRTSANFCGLFVGKARRANEDKRLALFGRKQFKRLTEFADFKSATLIR